MIRRRDDGEYVLISQAEHGRIAAAISQNLGGAFQPPADSAQLARALRLHASGFEPLDARPPLCPAGRPANFDDLPLVTLLEAWSASAEAALTAGAYPGMMVSLLCLQRTAAISSNARTLRETFQINKVQHRQVEIQEQLRPQLGLRGELPVRYGLPEQSAGLTDTESIFFYEYRLLLFCIQLALELCARRNVFGRLASTPPSPGSGAISVAYRMANAAQCTLCPFPLTAPLQLTIRGKRLPLAFYDHERELHEAMDAAKASSLALTIEP